MQEALTALLLGHAPLTDLVGQRVHWMRLPESVRGYPYVNLQVIGAPRRYHSTGPDALYSDRVQVDIWAETYAEKTAVERVLETLLSGFRDDVGATNIRGIFIDSGRDLTGETVKGERFLFRHQMDFLINWKET